MSLGLHWEAGLRVCRCGEQTLRLLCLLTGKPALLASGMVFRVCQGQTLLRLGLPPENLRLLNSMLTMWFSRLPCRAGCTGQRVETGAL